MMFLLPSVSPFLKGGVRGISLLVCQTQLPSRTTPKQGAEPQILREKYTISSESNPIRNCLGLREVAASQSGVDSISLSVYDLYKSITVAF
jgi:hypothetical protein